MTLPAPRPLEDVIRLLGSRVIAFHPKLVAITGRVTTGLMLSQSLYWSRKLALTQPETEGWFWKRRQDWLKETGLSRREQETARAELRRAGILEERMAGMPARLWFRVNLNRLATLIDADFDEEWNWHNEALVLRLLGRPILFHQPLAVACGSVTGAVLLSRLLSDERVAFRTGQTGWRHLDGLRVRQATGLTRHETVHARQKLREAGFIRERVVGVPPRVEWVMDLPRLTDALRATALLTAATTAPNPTATRTVVPCPKRAGHQPETPEFPLFAEKPPTNLPESDQQASVSISMPANPPNSVLEDPENSRKTQQIPLFAENQHTDLPESDQLICRKVASLVGGIRKISGAESGEIDKGLTTVNPITEKHPPPAPSASQTTAVNDQRAGGWGSCLFWPNTLLMSEREAARQMLQPVASKAQLLLDELSGQQDGGKTIVRPLSYLRALVRQELEGCFLPSVAQRVAARRDQLRQEAQARRATAMAAAPADPALLAAKNERARRMLAQMRRQLGGQGFTRAAG